MLDRRQIDAKWRIQRDMFQVIDTETNRKATMIIADCRLAAASLSET